MKTGKVTESVLKRSVLKQIRSNTEEVRIGAGVGEDCAVLASFQGADTALCVNTVTGDHRSIGSYSVHAAVNNLAAKGAVPTAILVSAVFPETTEEARLRSVMAQIGEEAAKLSVAVIGGHTEISAKVTEPVISVTGVGKLVTEPDKEGCYVPTKAKPGQDVVVTKWIGLAGTAKLAREKREELLTRYPAAFIDDAIELEQQLSVVPEAATAIKSGVCAMHDASGGGIFSALWELAEAAGVGLEIELKKLPIRQETVEVCDFFDVNPYEMLSGGSMVMTADNGYDLVRALEKEHIHAAVVGKITDSNDRIVINEEERRFLEPFRSDSIGKALT